MVDKKTGNEAVECLGNQEIQMIFTIAGAIFQFNPSFRPKTLNLGRMCPLNATFSVSPVFSYAHHNCGGEQLRSHSTSNFNFFHVAVVTLRIILPDVVTILAATSMSVRRTVVGYAAA